jgi:hypothetical protein
MTAPPRVNVLDPRVLRRPVGRPPDGELVDPDEPKIIPATFSRADDRIRIRCTAS